MLLWPYVSRPLEKGRAKRRIEMRRRRMLSSSPKHADVCVRLCMIPLLLVMRLWRISIRPYRATLLQGSTRVGLELQISANPQHKRVKLNSITQKSRQGKTRKAVTLR